MSDDQNELLRNPPCLRTGLLWGIATGTLIGAHHYRTYRNITKASDSAVLVFGAVAGISWLVCSMGYRTRKSQTRQFMETMNNPNRSSEAKEFLNSRVEPKREDDSK